LYVIVNAALAAGLKCAQAIHAFRAFVGEYPDLEAQWHQGHNNIVVLQHDDLPGLAERLAGAGFKLSQFHEPDLGDALTAICAEPGAWRQLSSLPLAG
jgi:hypothetical protein